MNATAMQIMQDEGVRKHRTNLLGQKPAGMIRYNGDATG